MNINKKPKIEKIKFTPEQQQEIEKINKCERVSTIKTIINEKTGVKRDIVYNHRFTFEMGRKRLREIYDGLCCVCGQWPDFSVLYYFDGAKRIERYCQKHFDLFKEGIK